MVNESENTAMENLVDENFLNTKAEEWERNRVENTLSACLSEVKDRSKDIEILFEDNKKKEAIRLVKELVRNELYECCKDVLRVPEYNQAAKAHQTIYIYLGTHWELLDLQLYFDFVKDGAKKMGLEIEYAEDPTFMNYVFEKLAFRVARYAKTAQPQGGVWINVKNLTVEVESSMLKVESSSKSEDESRKSMISTHEHRPEDFFQYCLPYAYDPYAECPMWHKFLDEVMPDKDMQTLLGEYIGYCFTKNIKLEKMAVFYGSGANGKSVIMDVLRQLFGQTNVSESTLSSVTTDPEARAQLQGKLVNISSESNRTIDSSILKMMVSGEAVEIRLLYIGTKLMKEPPKLITSYNELPPMENTYGYRRRWILFPFEKTIADDRQDPALARKLCTELPGILNWVLGLLKELIARVSKNDGEGFTYCQKCAMAMGEYAKSSNSVLMFLSDCCSIDANEHIKAKDLYLQYNRYCVASGIKKPFTQKNFKKFAVEWGATKSLDYNKVAYFDIKVDNSSYE